MVKITARTLRETTRPRRTRRATTSTIGLPLGIYDVEIEIDGKDVDKTTEREDQPRRSHPSISILLLPSSPTPRQQAAMQQAAASGQMTEELERGMTTEQKAAMEKPIKEQRRQDQEE